MTRRRPAVVAFDVNETLLDLAPVRAALVAAGQPESMLRAVFARTLLTGFAATLVGSWCSFRDAFDAALAVGGVFFVLTVRSAVLAVACAVFAAMLFGAIASLFTPWGLPALTLPFVFATLAFVLLKDASTKLVPVAVEDITTPEEHLTRTRGEHSGGVGRDAVPAS